MMRILNDVANNVGELIEILKDIPPDYSLCINGFKPTSVAVDDEFKCVVIDDAEWIDERVYEYNTEGED